MNDRDFPSLGSYDFGLSDSEEDRARRIHDEAIVIDFAFVHPGGYRVFEREPFKSGYQHLVGEYTGLELMEKLAFKFPYEADMDHMRTLWAQSGVTVGLVDAYYDMTKVDEPQANLEIIDLVPWLRLARNAADIRAAKAANEHALMLFCQPVGTVPRDLGAFERAYAGGLRTFMLTYNKTNVIGCGCTERLDHGLTDFGLELMALLGELGVIVDLSHCGRATTLEACKTSKHPVTANHTGAQALFEHARLKSDEELRAIADTGGIIGVFAIPFFMSHDADAGIDILLDHIDYITNLVGWQHVGLGSDTPHVAPKSVLAGVFDAGTLALLGFRPEDNVTPAQNFVGFDDYGDYVNFTPSKQSGTSCVRLSWKPAAMQSCGSGTTKFSRTWKESSRPLQLPCSIGDHPLPGPPPIRGRENRVESIRPPPPNRGRVREGELVYSNSRGCHQGK